MKNVFKKWVFATAVVITSGLFTACNSKSEKIEKKEEIVIAENNLIDNEEKNVVSREPVVFITGFDKGSESFYKNARAFFKAQRVEVVEGQYSLEEIINWLNNNAIELPYGEIHIVNKSNPYKGLTLETVIKGEHITTETLRKNITKGTLPLLQGVVNKHSKIIFHANGLGQDKELMKAFKDAFCANELPSVVASPYYSIFDGAFSKHYLAKPFYVFYPTANSPGKVDLSKEIARKYPEEKDLDWYDALNNEEERYVGEAYTTQFNIPVKFELDYHNSDDEIPTFTIQEEIMDFIQQKPELYNEFKSLNIPLEKFRWSWSRKNSTITIKGKTTGLVVLKPLIKPYGELEHIEPDTNNKRLYAMK